VGVATVTGTAHTISTNSKIAAFNFTGVGTSADYSFDTTDAAATWLSSTSFSYPSAGADIAAFTPNATYARVIQKSGASNVSTFLYANSYLKGALKLIDNLGHASETTVDMVSPARLAALRDSTAAIKRVLAGSNDAVGSIPVALTTSNLARIYAEVLNSGAVLEVSTLYPLGSGHAQFATGTPKIIQINEWIRQYARSTPGVVFVDAFSVMVDTAQTDGRAAAGMLQADNIHPAPKGARLVGRERGRILASVVPLAQTLTTTAVNYRANDTGHPNIWLGTPWTNSGGTLSGGASGTVAGGLQVVLGNVSTTATAVCSVISSPDGFGYMQQVVFTPGGASDTLTIQQASAATAAAFVTAGEVYAQHMRVITTGTAAANVAYVRVRNQVIAGGNTMQIGTPSNSSVSAVAGQHPDLDDVFDSPVPMVIPPGSITSLTSEVIVGVSAAGTALTIQVGRHTIERVTA
jgi:lysophospholipase L1-like esterase